MLSVADPNITDWMQGWGSTAGVFVSGLAVVITGLLLRHELRVRREEQADTAAAQARLVLPSIPSFSYGHNKDDGHLITHAAWRVVNYSGAPILEMRIRILRNGKIAAADNKEKGIYKGEVTREIVEEEISDWVPLAEPIDHPRNEHPSHPAGFSIEIEFIDSQGLVWRRRDRQPPERLLTVARKRRSIPIDLWVALGLSASGGILGAAAIAIGMR